MKHHELILQFGTLNSELHVIIGDERLIIDKFLIDSTKTIYQVVLNAQAQEKLIKKLVSNMKLVD